MARLTASVAAVPTSAVQRIASAFLLGMNSSNSAKTVGRKIRAVIIQRSVSIMGVNPLEFFDPASGVASAPRALDQQESDLSGQALGALTRPRSPSQRPAA